ncbi:ATP-binding protein [Arundinibacter roseus]|uniref:histidine kinase n=1 Tax=Arundinibacter roseus TaxID=2070510 RepID=A0A4R4K7T3_9BACT|nr:ATP-binding protein [Arundinibacter roseus]TDB63707.1 cyclic nucleotide-binding domain-containing protein [Arundinibacter roseus]
MNVLQCLQENENLAKVPEDELQWFIEHAKIRVVEEGTYLYQNGDSVDQLWIILEGRLRMFVNRNNQQRELGYNEKNYIGGLLPFSRLKTAVASAIALEKTTVLCLHRDQFKEMLQTQHELVQSFVHLMLDRIRDFTKLDQQNEKMISLGKLSAGLAHELNNPAAAVVRSASALKKHLGFVPEKFKRVISIQLSEEQVDKVNELLTSLLARGVQDMSLMEKSSLEDDLNDWLDDRAVENGYELAESFSEYGITTDDLDLVEEQVSLKYLAVVLDWLNNVLTTERMVGEIAEASQRIGNLVKSVKEYSHMDGGADKKKMVLRDGVESTLRMLQHKIKSKNIQVLVDMPDSLPQMNVSPGEMNQVWTNLIDNAVDALPDAGQIRIEAVRDREFVMTRVIDNGTGIPKDVIQQIFDPFFTTKEIGKGSGLGLEIAQNIVKRHRGQLTVTSEPGRTEFCVCLPIE